MSSPPSPARSRRFSELTEGDLLLSLSLDRAFHDVVVRIPRLDRAPRLVALEMEYLASGYGLSRPRDALERPRLGDDAVASHRNHTRRDRIAPREMGHPRLRIFADGQLGRDHRVLTGG